MDEKTESGHWDYDNLLQDLNSQNIRDMLLAGIKLERIELILGDSNSVRDIAMDFIKQGGFNLDVEDLEDSEFEIAN